MCDMDYSSDVETDLDVDSDCDVNDMDESVFEDLDDIADLDDTTDVDDESDDIVDEGIEPESSDQSMCLNDLEDIENEISQLDSHDVEMIDADFLEEIKAENADNPGFSDEIDRLIEEGKIRVENSEDFSEDDGDIKVLTRGTSDWDIEGRQRDMEIVLDDYRENLEERGNSEREIEEFNNREREKMELEYESLDRGDLFSNIYEMPTNWDVISEELSEQEVLENDTVEMTEDFSISDLPDVDEDIVSDGTEEELELDDENEEMTAEEKMEFLLAPNDLAEEEKSHGRFILDNYDIEDIESEDKGIEVEIPDLVETSESSNEEVENFEDTTEESENIEEIIEESSVENLDETNINYDEIYEEIEADELAQGFSNIDIFENAERLDNSLENFQDSNWEKLSMNEQKESIDDLANYIKDTIDFKNPPRIEYYNTAREGDYGGYNSATNTLSINEFMLHDANEAADTIAHELWHAHQRECADNPQSARDYQYQYNFENYITPELDHQAYENQLIEAEARAFAAQFKGRLADIQKGNSIWKHKL